MSPRDLGNKFCSSCKSLKTLREFNKMSASRDGRQGWCRQCNKETRVSVRAFRSKLEVSVMSKICMHCKVTKSASDFGRHNDTKDLLDHRCKACKVKQTVNARRVRRQVDPNLRLHTNIRKLMRKFFTSDSRDVADHRLVSKRTLERWIAFQKMLNDAPDNYDIDERWPNSKFDLENPYHCLVATNVLNYAPMDHIENIRKSNKILPELLLDHLNVADTFVNSEEHNKQEALKLRYLYDMYSNFVYKQLEILLNDSGILNNEVQE